MANVNYEVNKIRTAVYGEEVRGAIISAIEKVGVEGTNLSSLVDELEAELGERISRNSSVLETKGDNLYFDEEEKLLYLTSNGVPIGDGIAVSTGGGGGGGGGGGSSIYFYKPTIVNELSDRVITTTAGVDVNLRFSYSSVDDQGTDDGNGVGKIVIGGVVRKTFSALQGHNVVEISELLSAGSNSVKVTVENSEGVIRSLNYTVNIAVLSLETTNAEITQNSGAATVYYTVTGSGEKTVHFILDGTEIGTETVATSGRSRAYVIDEQTHGDHILEIYATSTVENISLESNHLVLSMYWVGDSAAAIIATPFSQTTATEGDTISIPYAVYDPTTELATVALKVIAPNGDVYSERTIQKDRSSGDTWIINDFPSGNVIFRIQVRDTVKNIPVTIEAYQFPIAVEDDSLILEFNANSRSNSESNPATWTYGNDISATFNGFSWSAADGWQHDSDNAAILRFLPGNSMDISYKPFQNNIITTGFTIEMDFATRDVRDYESVVISCLNGGRGFSVTSQKAVLSSNKIAGISAIFKEDSRIRVTFVVEQHSRNRMVYVYINAVMCGALQYPITEESFQQLTPQMIHFGSQSCGMDLYRMRIYGKDLSRNVQLENYICDKPTLASRQEAYNENNILNRDETISIDKIPPSLPRMIISCEELPQAKGDKKNATITFTDPTDSSKNFVVEASVDVQGTSSAGYPVKNLKFKAKSDFVNGMSSEPTYAIREGEVPVNAFCIKVDYASSEGFNNVGLVQLYEDICREQGFFTPPQQDDSRVRQGIAGRPIALFWHDTVHNETVFVSKANFNNDKGTPATFGFDLYPNAQAWDFRNNTSNLCLFKDADFSGDWGNDLESIYPEDYTDYSAIRRVMQFVSSHNRDTVNTEQEKAEMLADFKEHFSEYFIVDNMLFMYLFTEQFLMIDNRAKNIHLATYDTTHWVDLPYDFDSAIGIKC